MDNGMDEWTEGDGNDESEDEPAFARPVVPSISAYRPIVSAKQEEDFKSSLLDDLGNSATNPLPKKYFRVVEENPHSDQEPSSTTTRLAALLKGHA